MPARILLGALLTGLILAAPVRAEETTFPAHRDTLFVPVGTQVACLDHPFVLRSTLVLDEEGKRLRLGEDFALDADTGCFTLLRPDTVGIGRLLVASYRALGFDLEGSYRLAEDPHRRRAVEQHGAPASTGVVAFTGEEETEGLSISGSKTFGIEVGSRQDLKLSQSLDLRLTGQVSRDVSLLAILSDQDIPFQPQGNTAELSELDKVLVQLKAPHTGASLGDLNLLTSGMDFLEIRRDLEGFSGEMSTGNVTARGVVASAKGEFTTRQFFGQDGKQGPYRLTDRTGAENIVVVAGSEKVWLDGQPLERGEERDYVFDYSLGELTFTGKRAITANSEITVDYQYATARYRRRVAYAGAEGTLPVGRLRTAVFTEGDDSQNPFGGALSTSELQQLRAVGDSAQVAGGTGYVGPGNGDYKLVVDAETGDEIYVFVDGAGDYDVTFLNVGEGKGTYEPDETRAGSKVVYLYVGKGNGRFVPRRDLPAPQRTRVGDLRWDLERGGLALALEGAVSDQDGNVLSPLDDGDNRGGAVIAEATLRPVDLGGGWTAAPRARWRRVSETFHSPGRVRPAFFTRDWNLTGTEEVVGENLAEGHNELRWSDRFRWIADVGHLALADTFDATRQQQTVGWDDRWVAARGSWITTRSTVSGAAGSLDRTGGEVTLKRWKVQPRVQAFTEARRRGPAGGERHRDWESALRFPLGSWPLTAEVGAGRRLDDSLEVATGGWRPALESRRGFGSLEGSWRSLSFLLRYEGRRVQGEGRGTERRDTGRLDFRHQALRGAWNAVITGDVGTVGLRRREKIIGPDSTGYFDQFGNYIGPGGGYDVQYGPPGNEVLTGQVNLTTRLRWSPPGKEVTIPVLLRKAAWEGYFNLVEASSLPLVQPRYFLSPGSYLDRETTLDGQANARQILDLFPSNRSAGFRIRQELRRRMVQNPTLGGGKLVEIQNEDQLAGTLRLNPASGWDSELEGELGSRRSEVDAGTGATFVQDTDLRTGTVRGGRRFRALAGSGRASTEVSYSTEAGEGRRAVGWVLRPRLQWSLAGAGRVDVRYAWTRLTTRTGFTGIKGPGAPALTEGWRLDTVAELRVRKGIVVSAAFGIDRPQGLARVVRGRMEVRGTF